MFFLIQNAPRALIVPKSYEPEPEVSMRLSGQAYINYVAEVQEIFAHFRCGADRRNPSYENLNYVGMHNFLRSIRR